MTKRRRTFRLERGTPRIHLGRSIATFAVAALAAGVFLLGVSTEAVAAKCEGQSYSTSYCLDGNRNNPGWFSDSTWRAKNICRGGKLKASIGYCTPGISGCSGDGNGEESHKLGFNAEKKGTLSGGSFVGYVQCCDSGSDSLTIDGTDVNLCDVTYTQYTTWAAANPRYGVGDCRWHWRRSPADDRCSDETITFSGGEYDPDCTVTATCSAAGIGASASVTTTTRLWNFDDLSYCRDGFQGQACNYDCGGRYCHVGDCKYRYNRYGSARDTCRNMTATIDDDGVCTFTAQCREASRGGWTDTSLEVRADQAYGFTNCNGELRNSYNNC